MALKIALAVPVTCDTPTLQSCHTSSEMILLTVWKSNSCALLPSKILQRPDGLLLGGLQKVVGKKEYGQKNSGWPFNFRYTGAAIAPFQAPGSTRKNWMIWGVFEIVFSEGTQSVNHACKVRRVTYKLIEEKLERPMKEVWGTAPVAPFQGLLVLLNRIIDENFLVLILRIFKHGQPGLRKFDLLST